MNEPTRNRLLGVLFIGVLMAALDIAIVGPALPVIQQSYGVGERAIAWVFAIYVLFNLIGTPLMAKLSDISGRRSIYLFDVLLFALGSLIVTVAPNFELLLVGRAIQGLGAGGIFPVASAVIGDTFPLEKRGVALGLIGAVFGIAFLIGPILGGLLLIFGWRWLFVINIPIALLIIALGYRLLPSQGARERQPFDWVGMGLLTVILAAFAYGLNQLDSGDGFSGLLSSSVWPFLLVALLLLPLFIMVERRAVDPIIRLSLFGSRQVNLAAALSAGAGLSETAVVFIPALLVAAFGYSSSTASFLLLPMVLAMAIGSPASGRALDRVGSRLVVLIGTFLIGIALLLEALFPTSLVVFFLFSALFGVGVAILLGASLRYIMLNEASAAERASAQGIITLFTGVGQLFGSVLIGAIASSGGGGVAGYSTGLMFVAIVMLLLAVASLGLKSRGQELETVRKHADENSARPAHV